MHQQRAPSKRKRLLADQGFRARLEDELRRRKQLKVFHILSFVWAFIHPNQ
jgi:hypothetical protein